MYFKDVDQKFKRHNKDLEYGYYNSHSKIVFLMLFLYLIEPPFYFAINDASRKKDKRLLPMLCLLATALIDILTFTEAERDDDRVTLGLELHDLEDENKQQPLGHMSGSLLVFRGALVS